jgi:hypothetical protein
VVRLLDPAIFAGVFLEAADQAAGSLEQGSNPKDVASFLDLAGQAIAQHLQRMQADPSRKALLDQMTEQWKKLAKVHDQLVQMIQQQARQEAQQQQAMQEQAARQQSDFALQQQKVQGDLQLKAQKTQAGIQDKNIKTAEQIRLNREKAAASLGIGITKHVQETAMSQRECDQKMRQESEKKKSASDDKK